MTRSLIRSGMRSAEQSNNILESAKALTALLINLRSKSENIIFVYYF